MRVLSLWVVCVAVSLAGCQTESGVEPDPTPGAQPEPAPSTPEGVRTMDFFVGADAVPELRSKGAVFLDARSADEYGAGHMPGSVSAPWQSFTDKSGSGLLKADLSEIQGLLVAAGVRGDKPVVIVGPWASGWGEEGRLFWMLEYLGHRDVRVIYGGFEAWRASGGEVVTTASTPEVGAFSVSPDESIRATADEVLVAVESGNIVILDTRDLAEFEGATPYGSERGGAIPSAKHFSWKTAFDDGGGLQSPEAVRAMFRDLGVGPETVVMSYCTGGVRSGFVYMLMRWIGHGQPQNYDGSWWEWSGRSELPVESH